MQYLVWVGNALDTDAVGKVDTDPRMVTLCHTGRNIGASGQPKKAMCHLNLRRDRLADPMDLVPRHRRFKGLANDLILHEKIANVGNRISEQIAALAWPLATSDTAVSSRDFPNLAFLIGYLGLAAFHDNGGGSQRIGVKPFDAQKI